MSETADREHFDMLPFIAILMCTLGSLLYVTLIVASLCIGPGAGEGWIPVYEKGQPRKIPVLIEWDGRTALVHREGRKDRVPWDGAQTVTLPDGAEVLVGGEVSDASPLGRLLSELVQRKETHYALFAVRPGGFETFNQFSDTFRERGIDVGYEPVEEGRPVRLLPEGGPRT